MQYTPPDDIRAEMDELLGAHEISTRALAGGAGTVVVIKRLHSGAASSFVVEPDAPRARIESLWRGWYRNLSSGAATHARRALRLG